MTKLLILFLLLTHCIVYSSNSQDNKYDDLQWGNGNLVLNDGTTINGKIHYNFITGVLSYKNESKPISYSARTVAQFTVNDKKYYSLPAHLIGSNSNEFLFFELIYEKGSLAILSRYDYSHERKLERGYDGHGYHSYHVANDFEEDITESIYLANNEGLVTEYAKRNFNVEVLEDSKDDHDILSFSKKEKVIKFSEIKRHKDTEYKITNRSAIKAMTSDSYSKVKFFNKKEDIQMNTVEGLIKILDYYSTIDN